MAKVAAEFERTDSNFERSTTVGNMLVNSIAYYREIIHERKSQSIWKSSLLSYFKTNKIWVATATPPFSNRHPDQSAAINIEARPSTRKNTMTIEGTHDGYQFIAIKSFWVCTLF